MVNAATRRETAAGPAGLLECAIDEPVGDPLGTALICHPHPLHGGTLDNKVVQTLTRAFVQCGWRAVRFNFRGVGRSQGSWDHGRGEVDDAQAVLQAFARGDEPVALAGFSFGGAVAAQLAQRLGPVAAVPPPVVLVAPAVVNFPAAPVHADALVVQGEADDVVALHAVLDWARPQALPVVVVPGVGHFFHGHLNPLRHLVVRHLQAEALRLAQRAASPPPAAGR
jgi:hypothetical protein